MHTFKVQENKNVRDANGNVFCKSMSSRTMVHAKLEKTLPGAAKYIIAIGAGWTAGIYSVNLVKNAAPYAIENTKTQMESGDLKYWKAAQWGF